MNVVKILNEYIDVRCSTLDMETSAHTAFIFVHLLEPSGYGPNIALPLKTEGAVLSIETIH